MFFPFKYKKSLRLSTSYKNKWKPITKYCLINLHLLINSNVDWLCEIVNWISLSDLNWNVDKKKADTVWNVWDV